MANTVHFRNKAKELIPKWNREGFNGIRLFTELELDDDPVEGEQTLEEKQEQDRNYAIFAIEADLFTPVAFFDPPPYVSVELDDSRFWEEFTAMLQKEFGPDAEIKRHSREIEITRKK